MKFVFSVSLKPGKSAHEYLSAWKKGSEIIQTSRGAQGTILFRKIGDPRTLLAIASWESKSARDAAMKKLDEAGFETQTVLNKHKQFGDTSVLGNFQEIARVEGRLG